MIVIACLLLFMIQPMEASEVVELRKLYYQASVSKEAADRFFRRMKERKNAEPLMMSYEGMAYLFQAKYAFNPYTKLTSFNKGKTLLDKAIVNAPDNIEIRFMRFSVQSNAPSFLGYSGELNNDKAAIIKGWGKIADTDLKDRIKKYMATSDYCTDDERAKFK